MQKLQDQTILKEVDHNQLKQSFVKAMADPLFRKFVESLGIKEELLEKCRQKNNKVMMENNISLCMRFYDFIMYRN